MDGRDKKARLVFIWEKKFPVDRANQGEIAKKAIVEVCREMDVEVLSGRLNSDFVSLDVSYPAAWLSIEEIIRNLQTRGRVIFLQMGGGADLVPPGIDWLGRNQSLISDGDLQDIDLVQPVARPEKEKKEVPAVKRGKCLVTGGAGFIGSNMTDELIARGYEVVVVDSLASGRQDYVNKSARFYQVDICDRERVEDIFDKEGIDYVFHFAAQIDVRKSVADPEFDARINLFGGMNIIDCSIKYGVKKLLFSSTGGAIYGGATQIPTTEEYPANPLSPYGIHKLTFEKYLNYAYRASGLEYAALRMANVYGPRQYKGGEAGVIAIFVDAAVAGREITIYGDGRQTRDYVYVGDVVKAFMTALESGFIGEANIGTAVETDILELISAIERQSGTVFDKTFAPARAGEERRSCLSFEKASKELGWEPTVGLDEGLARTIEWSRKKNN